MSCSTDQADWQLVEALLSPLRLRVRAWEHRPIVVMTPTDAPDWLCDAYPDVAFLRGLVSKFEDSERMSLEIASEIVLLSGDRPARGDSGMQDHSCVVAATVFEQILRSTSDSSAGALMCELHSAYSANFLPQVTRIE